MSKLSKDKRLVQNVMLGLALFIGTVGYDIQRQISDGLEWGY